MIVTALGSLLRLCESFVPLSALGVTLALIAGATPMGCKPAKGSRGDRRSASPDAGHPESQDDGPAWDSGRSERQPPSQPDGGSSSENCSEGDTRPCYGDDPQLAGVGACTRGTQTCEVEGEFGPSWGECTGYGTPSEEQCENGIDDDCDGTADEGCVCEAGARRDCYPGPADTAGVGACRGGEQRCNGAGSGWGDCQGAVTPSEEQCGDDRDNDCDGRTDETCGPACEPTHLSWHIPAEEMATGAGDDTGAGECFGTVYFRPDGEGSTDYGAGDCGEYHCGTLRYGDGDTREQYCTVYAECIDGEPTATRFSW
jgi:hypothetical protein